MSRARQRVAVLGAGGHGKVVVATCLAAGLEVVSLFDDDPAKRGSEVLGIPVRGPIDAAAGTADSLVIALGDNQHRKRISMRLPGPWATVIHPHALIHTSCEIGEGTVVFAGVIVQPETNVGRHVILNTAVQVDHDCRLGNWVHCAPGTRLAGSVTLGEGAFTGVGASVAPGLVLGAWSVLGAGSCAIRDVAAELTVGGVPARELDPRPPGESRKDDARSRP